MSNVMHPASMDEALAMLRAAWGFLAGLHPAGMPAERLAGCLREMERADALAAAARGPMLAAFDAQDGPVADGQRNIRTWLVHTGRVTRGQAAEYRAVQALAEGHPVLLAGLAEGDAITKSVALQLGQVDHRYPGRVPGPGRGDPDRRRPRRRGPAGAGRDLRGDPRPHRTA